MSATLRGGAVHTHDREAHCLKIGCPEEVAYHMGFVSRGELRYRLHEGLELLRAYLATILEHGRALDRLKLIDAKGCEMRG
jgi:hypothetical protein